MMMMENGERNDGMGVLRVISSIVKLRGGKKGTKERVLVGAKWSMWLCDYVRLGGFRKEVVKVAVEVAAVRRADKGLVGREREKAWHLEPFRFLATLASVESSAPSFTRHAS